MKATKRGAHAGMGPHKNTHTVAAPRLRPTVAAVVALCAMAAQAQQTPPAQPPQQTQQAQQPQPAPQQAQPTQQAPAAEGQKIVVTGTSIRGIAPVGTPLKVVNRADIEASGATTATELLRSVPEIGSFNSTGINTGSNQANFVDQPAIHGVGVGNGGAGLTLVLIDGRRLPGAGINQTAPDAGAIPASAIERVEVMADGGSAVYGSDAVAGVINFVTRKNFNGGETNLRLGVADGYKTRNFSQLLGRSWDSGSVFLTYEFAGNTALNGRSRSYVTNDQRSVGGADSRSTTCTPANVTVGGQTWALSPGAAPALGAAKCDSNVANDLYPEQDRHQVFGKLRQDINDRVSLYASLLYSDRTIATQVSGGGITSGPTSFNITGASPYYIQMPGTIAGEQQSVTYDPGRFTNNITTKTLSAAVGTDIEIGGGWSGKLEYNRGLERDDVRNHGMNAAVAQSAIDAGNFNPYGIGAANNPSVLASVNNFQTRYYGRQTLDQFIAKADGPLFKISGGMVRAAVGVEHRKETFDGSVETGPVGGSNTPLTALGSRKSDSVFAEVFAPVIGEANALPGMRKLELTAAVRHDKYSDVGGTTNPKVGLNWTVVNGAIARVSAGRSFHAPSLADATTAIDTRLIRFPCIPFAFVGCDSATAADYSVIIAGGNKLKPETARTLNVGFDFGPALLGDGMSASLAWFSIDYKDVITFPTFGPVVNPLAAYDKYRVARPAGTSDAAWLAIIAPLLGDLRHDGVVYPDTATLPTAVYDLRRQNFADEFIRGFDYRIGKTWQTGYGTVHANLAGTHLTKFDQKVPGIADPIVLLGTNYAVKDKVRAQLGWARGDVAASLFLNYTGGYNNATTGGTQKVGSFKTADVHLAWTLPSSTMLGKAQLVFDVSNIGDTKPPTYFTTGNNGVAGFDPSVSSPIGRMISVGLQKTW